ncbi:PEP-CTERM sorting domain-containing protein [Opitutaceae bacterium]|nr:PEP-CTERM sorting domain-containing protein [Opitutaceae bacterium]
MKIRIVTALTLIFATVPLVTAVTLDIKWLGGSGTWSTTGNWDTDSLPGGTNHTQIDPLNAFNVTVNVDTAAITSSLTIGAGDTVSIANAQSLTLDPQSSTAALVLNSGSSLALNSAGNTTSLVISDGTLTASGAGSIDLSNKSNNRIIGSASATLINQSTIQGAGQLSDNSLIVNNQGTISALYATALIFDPSASADALNSGTLKAANGGLLQLINGAINNASGQVLADTGGSVELSGITIKDGTLKTTGTGTIKATGTTVLSDGVTIDTGSNVYVNNAVTLQVADTLTIDGTLLLNSAGNTTNLIVTSATTTFDGTGKVSLSNNTNNKIYGSPSTNTLVNKVTIEGAGQIGSNSATINNQGTVSALYSNALKLDPGAGGFTNTGTLNAATGGLLQLGNGTFTNTGGTISAATGSEIELLSGAKIIGGTLSSTGTGFIESNTSATLDGVSLPSGTDYRIPNAANTTLLNTISNAGTINLQSAGNATDLIIDAAGATLTGSGVISLSQNTNNRIYGTAAASHLTNTNNTIRGSGQLGVGQLTFTNQGTVEANLNGATLTVDPASTAFINTGNYRAVNGGVLVLNSGSFNNTSGTIQAQTNSTVRLSGSTAVTHGTLDVGPNATLQLAGGSFDSGNLTTSTGSTIESTSGNNTLGGTLNLNPGANLNVKNASTLSLKTGGTYTIDGTLTMSSAGNLTDLVISSGDVTLAGSGKVVLDNNTNNRIYGTPTSSTLILNGLNLEGGGQLGVNSMGVSSNATITANATTALTVDPSTTGFTNTGTLKADGGTLALTGGTYTNTGGTIESTSTTNSIVQFNGSTFTGGTLQGSGLLTTVGSNTFNGISLNSGATLTIANATSGTFSGTFNNAGTLKLNSAGNLTDAIAASGGLTLSGGGSVQLIGSNSRIYGTTAATTLTNTNNKIHGYGQLGVNQLLFNNQSNVAADVSGQTLTVDASATITNTGLFKAENGGTLTLQSSTFNNQTGGSIQSDASSNVFLSSLTLNDGHLTGAGTFRNTVSSTYANLRIDSGTTLDIDNATSATLTGTLNNAGQIHLNSVGNLTNLIAGSGGLTLSGGGEIHLYGHANNRIYGINGTTTLTNSNNTIKGYGQIGVNQLKFVNQGTVTADTSGQTLTIDTTNGLTNSGTLKSENGGTLLISDSVLTSQSGATLNSGSGSVISISNSSTLNDTTISGTGSFISSSTNTFSNLTVASDATLDINNSTTATFTGTLNNSGKVKLNSAGNLTNFVVGSGGLNLTGAGRIDLSANSANRIYGINGAATLNNHSAHTIRGSGQIGINQLTLVNSGTIEATGSSPLVFDLTPTFTNQGTLKATGTGGITFNDAFTNQKDINVASGSNLTLTSSAFTQTAGATQLDGGTFSATSLQVDGGDFDGKGTVSGATTFTGSFLAPAAGGLTFNSSLTLNSATTVQIELAGTSTSTGYGNLTANSVAIAGSLQVRFGSSFQNTITNSDVFTFLSATSSQSGTFSNAPSGTRFWTSDGLGSFDVTYNSLSVTLSNFQPVPEPSTWSLFALGGCLIVWQSRRRRG